jgi:hypothetical protein
MFSHTIYVSASPSFPLSDGKPTEPRALKAALAELLELCPFIQIFTGDALLTERPLAKVILDAGHNFVLTVKDNQPNLLEAFKTSFHDAES